MNLSNVKQEDALGGLIESYSRTFGDCLTNKRELSPCQWGEVEERLCTQCGWTPEGSAQVAQLARDYGASTLRNALALAIALGVNEGALNL